MQIDTFTPAIGTSIISIHQRLKFPAQHAIVSNQHGVRAFDASKRPENKRTVNSSQARGRES